MEILSRPFTADTSSFEAFDAKISVHERRTSKAIDDDVKVGSSAGRHDGFRAVNSGRPRPWQRSR